MRIDGGLPLNVARAYGLPRTTANAAATPVRPDGAPAAPTPSRPAAVAAPVRDVASIGAAAPAGRIAPTATAAPPAVVGPATGITAPRATDATVASGGNVDRLVAGRVPGGVDFHAASTATSPAGAYQFYTRAADRVEASVMMRTGARIDVTG